MHIIEKIANSLKDFYGIPVEAVKRPDPVDLLAATILSQNTNDRNSYKAFKSLKEKYPDWNEVVKLSERQIESVIKTAGLAKQKASAIKSFLKFLINTRGSITLRDIYSKDNDTILNELTSVKGIGIKTASCVLLFSMGRDVCPVDTHVHRVLNRTGAVKTTFPEKTFYLIKDKIPSGRAHELHTNLIRLGREICKPAVPLCFSCPLKKICRYPAKDFSRKVLQKSETFFLLDNVSIEK